MFEVELPKIPKQEYYINDYGAVSGGKISNTDAIRDAIAEAAQHGGGKVVIPAGIWLTGPIELKSHIELHVKRGAVLLFDKCEEEYPLYLSDFEGMQMLRCQSPIWAEQASDIAITGHGVIDGNGQLWRPVKQFKVTDREWSRLLKKSSYVVDDKEGGIWLPTKTSYEGFLLSYENAKELTQLETAQKYWDFFRPVMVRFYQCDHILIEGVTLQNSPAWNVHPCFCQHITIQNVVIRNPYYAQNGDGLDLESCRYAEIADCTFDVGDDAICMKSGKGEEARKQAVPTQDVFIHDCVVYHGHGGFVVGSEMSRGIRNVMVKNCSFIGTDVGIRFKSALGRGGVVEQVQLEHIHMHAIEKEAIIFTMGYVLDYREEKKQVTQVKAEDIPYFKQIEMKHITCDSAETGLKVEGIDMKSLHVIGQETPANVIDEIIIKDSMICAKNATDIKYAGKISCINTVFE